jgi:hypothetical protein
MFHSITRPTPSFGERLSLYLTVLVTLTCLLGGVLAFKGASRLVAMHGPERSSEVLLVTSLEPGPGPEALCVESPKHLN